MGGGILVLGHLMSLNETYNVFNRRCNKVSQRFKRTYEMVKKAKVLLKVTVVPSPEGRGNPRKRFRNRPSKKKTRNHRNHYAIHG